ncbi:hypothetical protein PYCCODRAFT_91501 [Trametes coccinea BRFM310]|uniref:Uncharacterized protein n=1 Tax=Trametes coccinea (strain BRFM310) TaxID=1353009 RepID=A0A1Y2I8W3_TRAC3|nr:hypothetical protein PYCCODRAFT_91501 [Trametes coccinea BRFM310]
MRPPFDAERCGKTPTRLVEASSSALNTSVGCEEGYMSFAAVRAYTGTRVQRRTTQHVRSQPSDTKARD